MNVKKTVLIVVLAILLCVFGFLIIAAGWSKTPHGDLDMRAAILIKYVELAKYELFKPGQSVAEIRAVADNSKILKKKPRPVAELRDVSFEGPGGELKLRIYRPVKGELLPVVVYYHGGGWTLGGLDSHDNLCRAISNAAHAALVSVDYRLAPEHPFPAAVDDAYAGLVWAHENAKSFGGDPSRIALAGDSAGGNLAAVVAVLARDRSGPRISHQALFYPATDLANLTTESHRNFAQGYYLTKNYIEKFREMYVPDKSKWSDPRVSPLFARNLSGLPPALVITAEFDSLRDEGESYAQRLQKSGVPVHVQRFPGMIHGFLGMERIFPQSAEAVELIGVEMKKHLASR